MSQHPICTLLRKVIEALRLKGVKGATITGGGGSLPRCRFSPASAEFYRQPPCIREMILRRIYFYHPFWKKQFQSSCKNIIWLFYLFAAVQRNKGEVNSGRFSIIVLCPLLNMPLQFNKWWSYGVEQRQWNVPQKIGIIRALRQAERNLGERIVSSTTVQKEDVLY